jgi:hypothetical protein
MYVAMLSLPHQSVLLSFNLTQNFGNNLEHVARSIVLFWLLQGTKDMLMFSVGAARVLG